MKIYNVETGVPCVRTFEGRKIQQGVNEKKSFLLCSSTKSEYQYFDLIWKKSEKIGEESPDIRDVVTANENGSKIMDSFSKIRFYVLVFPRF